MSRVFLALTSVFGLLLVLGAIAANIPTTAPSYDMNTRQGLTILIEACNKQHWLCK